MARQFQASLGLYLLVGMLGTALQFVVLLGMVELAGMAPAMSASVGALCGAMVAYEGNRRFTFDCEAPHRHLLPRFLTVASLAAAANGALVWAGTDLLGAHYLAVQVFATAVVFFAGFMMNQRWTFA